MTHRAQLVMILAPMRERAFEDDFDAVIDAISYIRMSFGFLGRHQP